MYLTHIDREQTIKLGTNFTFERTKVFALSENLL